MSPDYLSHYFTEKTGYQLNNYIRDKRIKKAQLLLADSSLSIQEISDMTGFSSVSYFHTAFKNVCGVTPQQYRQAASKSAP
ncbi:MAG: helix-turn-helix transcriptional regulator [Lachnospiraceae bacterium]|nr:helix-turn-helix transcriptional regulator [Lachnospiraceae bacterium]